MRLGAQLFTCRELCRDADGLERTLDAIAEIGYPCVQVSGIGPIPPEHVADILRRSGLECAGTHMGWDAFLNDLDRVIDTHRMWGCRHAAIGALPPQYRTAEGLERFLEELPPVAEGLAAADIDFSYHNHDFEFFRLEPGPAGATWLGALYDRTRPEHLKAELDVYWVQAGGGDPAAWIERLGPRQPLLHLKDMLIRLDADAEGGRERRFAEIGEGNLNWPAILEAARRVGVEYALVEQDNCYECTPIESLRISHANLKRMGVQ